MICPAHEKFVMAKLRLPEEVKEMIRRYLPKTPPTPTARLMKEVRFQYCMFSKPPVLIVSGYSVRKDATIQAKWSSPPCLPAIEYQRKLSKLNFGQAEWNSRVYKVDETGGELDPLRRYDLRWPCLDFVESYTAQELAVFAQSPEECSTAIEDLERCIIRCNGRSYVAYM